MWYISSETLPNDGAPVWYIFDPLPHDPNWFKPKTFPGYFDAEESTFHSERGFTSHYEVPCWRYRDEEDT